MNHLKILGLSVSLMGLLITQAFAEQKTRDSVRVFKSIKGGPQVHITRGYLQKHFELAPGARLPKKLVGEQPYEGKVLKAPFRIGKNFIQTKTATPERREQFRAWFQTIGKRAALPKGAYYKEYKIRTLEDLLKIQREPTLQSTPRNSKDINKSVAVTTAALTGRESCRIYRDIIVDEIWEDDFYYEEYEKKAGCGGTKVVEEEHLDEIFWGYDIHVDSDYDALDLNDDYTIEVVIVERGDDPDSPSRILDVAYTDFIGYDEFSSFLELTSTLRVDYPGRYDVYATLYQQNRYGEPGAIICDDLLEVDIRATAVDELGIPFEAGDRIEVY